MPIVLGLHSVRINDNHILKDQIAVCDSAHLNTEKHTTNVVHLAIAFSVFLEIRTHKYHWGTKRTYNLNTNKKKSCNNQLRRIRCNISFRSKI